MQLVTTTNRRRDEMNKTLIATIRPRRWCEGEPAELAEPKRKVDSMRRLIPKRLLVSAAGMLVAVAIAGGVAYATIPGPGNVYSACMLKGVGTIRLIDKSLPSTNVMSHCTDKEIEISWNQAGQPRPAGPQGAKGEPGAPGTNGTNGTDGKAGVSVTTASEPAGANCA